MKAKGFLLILIMSLLLSCSGIKSPEREEGVIKDTIANFNNAFDSKNMSGLLTLCADDMCWYTLNGKILRKNQIMGFFASLMSRWDSIKTSASNIEIKIDGDIAVARYASEIKITFSGKENKMHNLQSMILIRQEGNWRIWQYHMSTE